jgi:hypothetical protein
MQHFDDNCAIKEYSFRSRYKLLTWKIGKSAQFSIITSNPRSRFFHATQTIAKNWHRPPFTVFLCVHVCLHMPLSCTPPAHVTLFVCRVTRLGEFSPIGLMFT